MSYHSYTILECTNPELISSGSTFVKESNSKLLKIENNKSHFVTWKSTMDNEIFRLSLIFPEDTFTAKWHWDDDYYDRIIYSYEYKNGQCKVLGIEPEYLFFNHPEIKWNDEHYMAFRDHVLEYLKRLDIVKKVNGCFELDKLNNERDEYGYESQITITYENDQYMWTAERTGISFIEVSVEKKAPRKNNLEKSTDINEIIDSTSDDGLPF